MICRLCLQNLDQETPIHLFGINADDAAAELIGLITKYFDFRLTATDAFSTSICRICKQHLRDFAFFCIYVEEKQKSLCNEFVACDVNVDEKSETVKVSAEPLVKFGDVLSDNENLPLNKDYIESNAGVTLKVKSISSITTEAENQSNVYLLGDAEYSKWGEKTEKSYRCASHSSETDSLENISIDIRERKPSKKRSCKKQKNSVFPADESISAKKIRRPKEDVARKDEFVAKHMKLKCDICGVPNDTFRKLMEHFSTDHKCQGYVKCCELHIRGLSLLIDHINWHLDPEIFKCKLCGKCMKAKHNLWLHMKTGHLEGESLSYACTECGKRFLKQAYLEAHMLRHQNKRNFPCSECDKAKDTLRSHMNFVHNAVAAFVCDTCGRSYKDQINFKRHVNDHQGIKEAPAQCNICGKWSKNKAILKIHLKGHNQVDAHLGCQHCNKVFATKILLSQHVKRMHMDKPFKCNACEKTFAAQTHLERHIQNHNGEKNFKCAYCAKQFLLKGSVDRHVKLHHHDEWIKTCVPGEKYAHFIRMKSSE